MTNRTELLSTPEAARHLGIAEQTLRGWRAEGRGPPYVKIGSKLVRYRAADLEAWIKGRVTSPREAEK